MSNFPQFSGIEHFEANQTNNRIKNLFNIRHIPEAKLSPAQLSGSTLHSISTINDTLPGVRSIHKNVTYGGFNLSSQT